VPCHGELSICDQGNDKTLSCIMTQKAGLLSDSITYSHVVYKLTRRLVMSTGLPLPRGRCASCYPQPPDAFGLWTFRKTELRNKLRLDSIVTVVDADNFSLDTFKSGTNYNQIAYGDILLLNKADLVIEATLQPLESWIHIIKGGSRIVRKTHGKVDLARILDVGLFEPQI
jgi:G3E family GTPase